jgi:hypothetical protein
MQRSDADAEEVRDLDIGRAEPAELSCLIAEGRIVLAWSHLAVPSLPPRQCVFHMSLEWVDIEFDHQRVVICRSKSGEGLGILMRALLGAGTPREMAAVGNAVVCVTHAANAYRHRVCCRIRCPDRRPRPGNRSRRCLISLSLRHRAVNVAFARVSDAKVRQKATELVRELAGEQEHGSEEAGAR